MAILLVSYQLVGRDLLSTFGHNVASDIELNSAVRDDAGYTTELLSIDPPIIYINGFLTRKEVKVCWL